jgi:hypothetical protein
MKIWKLNQQKMDVKGGCWRWRKGWRYFDSIQSRTGRPNDELNDTFATAIIDDLIGSDIDFIKEDVSILFYLN